MIYNLPIPRLLPWTIAAIAALLGVKSVVLVRAAVPPPPATATLLASAQAAAPVTKPAAAPGHGASAAGSPQPDPAPAQAPPQKPEPAPVSDAERSVLLELRQRRQELDAREVTLTARESMLAALEQKLSARVAELTALQKQLEALDAVRQQREDTEWQRLVKVYEVMKPRDAAAIFNELQMSVLLPVVDRMKESKAAPVLAAMNPDKARDLTAELAKLRTGRNTQTDAAKAAANGGRPAAQ